VLALNIYYGSPAVGLAAAREAVRIAMGTNDIDLQLHALNRLIVVLLYQGKLHTEEGIRAFDLASPRLKRSGDLILKFFIRLNKAVWHLEIGELEPAEAAFREVEPVIRGSKATDAHAMLFLNEGELYLARQEFGSAAESFQKAESYLRPSSPKAFETIINSGLGLCALFSGSLGEARRREQELPPLPTCWAVDPSVVVLFKSKMLKRRGDLDGAEKLLFEVSEDVRGRLVTAWVKLAIERIKLARKTRPNDATLILKEALAVTEILGLEQRERDLKAFG
jgi:tetratricopeptide (TPR) repeat protein